MICFEVRCIPDLFFITHFYALDGLGKSYIMLVRREFRTFMKQLTFITGNADKAKYLSDFFHLPVSHEKLDLKEIQSLDLREVVEDKVIRAYEILKSPVLVEDVSLRFTAMSKLPGPLIKWFLETLGNDGLCKLIPEGADRSALAEVQFAYCDNDGLKTFSGSASGRISKTPQGGMGFGWDSIFIPEGHTKTWAEMTDREKHATSMRRQALEKLAEFLQTN